MKAKREVAAIEELLKPKERDADEVIQARAENLIAKVRAWRKLLPQLLDAKEAMRLVEEERELRKEMGQALGCESVTLRVDGRALIYRPKSTLGPEDYESEWKSFLPTLSEEDRSRAVLFLQRKSDRIMHEFVTE